MSINNKSICNVRTSLAIVEILIVYIIAFVVFNTFSTNNVLERSVKMSDISYACTKHEFNLPQVVSSKKVYKVNRLVDTRTPEQRQKDNVFFNARRVQELYPDVELSLILAIIQKESHYDPTVNGSGAIGLMQIIPSCHTDRISRLGVTDIWDPYSNILVGTDLINDLLKIYKDPGLALMCYNMGEGNALYKYNNHGYSGYALEVLSIKEEIERSERYATYSHQAEKVGSDSRDS